MPETHADLSSTALPSQPGVPLLSVCVTCRARTAEAPPPGPAFKDLLTAALAEQAISADVRAVQCLSVCSRAATVAVQARDGYTFLFGDLAGADDAAALATFVRSYGAAAYGFVPWRDRPEALRKKIVARLPPAAWSPADGRQPS